LRNVGISLAGLGIFYETTCRDSVWQLRVNVFCLCHIIVTYSSFVDKPHRSVWWCDVKSTAAAVHYTGTMM